MRDRYTKTEKRISDSNSTNVIDIIDAGSGNTLQCEGATVFLINTGKELMDSDKN